MFHFVPKYSRFIKSKIGWHLLSMQSEEERLRDQREREEFERHIRERDAAGTRKVHSVVWMGALSQPLNKCCWFVDLGELTIFVICVLLSSKYGKSLSNYLRLVQFILFGLHRFRKLKEVVMQCISYLLWLATLINIRVWCKFWLHLHIVVSAYFIINYRIVHAVLQLFEVASLIY